MGCEPGVCKCKCAARHQHCSPFPRADRSPHPCGLFNPHPCLPRGEPREPSAGTQHATRSGRQREANMKQNPRACNACRPTVGGRDAALVVMRQATVASYDGRTTDVRPRAYNGRAEKADPKPNPRRRCCVGPEQIPSIPHNRAGTAGGWGEGGLTSRRVTGGGRRRGLSMDELMGS